MPTIRRTRVIAAAPERVWATVADPHHLPRWWPRVARVEGVDGRHFTEVLRTDRGKAVRADFTVIVPDRDDAAPAAGYHYGKRGTSQSHGCHHVQAVHKLLPFQRSLPEAAHLLSFVFPGLFAGRPVETRGHLTSLARGQANWTSPKPI